MNGATKGLARVPIEYATEPIASLLSGAFAIDVNRRGRAVGHGGVHPTHGTRARPVGQYIIAAPTPAYNPIFHLIFRVGLVQFSVVQNRFFSITCPVHWFRMRPPRPRTPASLLC